MYKGERGKQSSAGVTDTARGANRATKLFGKKMNGKV